MLCNSQEKIKDGYTHLQQDNAQNVQPSTTRKLANNLLKKRLKMGDYFRVDYILAYSNTHGDLFSSPHSRSLWDQRVYTDQCKCQRDDSAQGFYSWIAHQLDIGRTYVSISAVNELHGACLFCCKTSKWTRLPSFSILFFVSVFVAVLAVQLRIDFFTELNYCTRVTCVSLLRLCAYLCTILW